MYTCKCGKILYSSVNAKIEYKIYSDFEWDAIVNDDSIVDSVLIPHSKHYIWVCPECKRAYIFESDTEKVKHVYSLEECHINTSEKCDVKVDLCIMRLLQKRLRLYKLNHRRKKK